MFEKAESLGYLASHLARLMSGRLRDELQSVGLMPAQFTALVEISRDEGLTQKDLVERLDVEQPGVARTLNGLEAEGWIERRQKSGRSQGLYLTEKSRAVLPRAADIAMDINRRSLEHLSKTERAHLLDALSELVAELKTG